MILYLTSRNIQLACKGQKLRNSCFEAIIARIDNASNNEWYNDDTVVFWVWIYAILKLIGSGTANGIHQTPPAHFPEPSCSTLGCLRSPTSHTQGMTFKGSAAAAKKRYVADHTPFSPCNIHHTSPLISLICHMNRFSWGLDCLDCPVLQRTEDEK